MTPLEHKLLAALWRQAMWYCLEGRTWNCAECDACGKVKHHIAHQPGCTLFGLDPALLASLDSFEIAAGETV